ncbi:hypothetical protein B0A48_17340 [Cryoendolithus antarcticus]|uniref:Uncharacterized protein n=1 Tax=Cryoendolithus antarcticus TaxID=1507870 RepID=A0A1V8SCX1_9PEZI|nr:hypothetical protein B0A48_17340 [Cryoendolithus antarcticus]
MSDAEIRAAIWKYTVCLTEVIEVTPQLKVPGICSASRQARAGSHRMYFTHNTFKLGIWDLNTTLVARFDLLANSRNLEAWLKAIWGASGQHEFMDGLIYTYGTVTPNLEFAGRAQEIAKALRGAPWENVEKVPHSLRNIFMRSDLQWGRDLD